MSAVPQKTRELRNHHFDSTIWNDFPFRDDDVIVATYAKSGTTWTQQIVAQLIFGGDEALSVAEISPWMDLRLPPAEVKLAAVEAQTHRRVMKTHLPVDALAMSAKARYLYIGRDGRDVLWSLYNHHVTANADWYAAINDTPGRVGPPIGRPEGDVVEYFRAWLAQDGHPFWPYWENVRSWWAIRDLPNVMLVHFEDLKRDMEGEMRRIAEFLGIEVDPARWPTILRACTFEHMKANAHLTAPLGGAFWDGGGASFINKGVNGRWTSVLPEADRAAYEARALSELDPDCARWLAEGHGARVAA
ncbi:sulfotransferase domain-containing protein [uncultured Albimonas sp.]|uniref:sulfotransferase domain-containing protein n=1 Tax=uncultured Albimonas sp. TaxID=1331701 RepID=UPI0030ED4646|tara:strand:+ start:191 stop:1099 length:909 start_codon:yes stop_codon:yes gene_type:complete